jgi:peptide/nickel transport system substrate-binding protein
VPGYTASPPLTCPTFDLAGANTLLKSKGWVMGSDGVYAKNGQRLEFQYSTTANNLWRSDDQLINQANFKKIGIKLDIQNYPYDRFYGSFLLEGQASPPTGAVAGRYDIAESEINWGYDPDDSSILSCNQIPPKGYGNIDFYCNHSLDTLYKQELAAVDPGVRQQIFQQIHQIYLTELPFIVLDSPTEIAMVHNGTHNYQIGPFYGEANIAEWWCDQGKC